MATLSRKLGPGHYHSSLPGNDRVCVDIDEEGTNTTTPETCADYRVHSQKETERLRPPSAMVKESTPSLAKSHSLLTQASGFIEPRHCSPLPVSPDAITRRPQTPQLMAWSFPQASSRLVTTIVVLRHWGQAAAR